MRSPFNVLYLSSIKSIEAGASRSIFDLISCLDRNKVQPFYASIYEGQLTESLEKIGAPYLRLKSGNIFHPILKAFALPDLVHFIKHNKIDIVHNNQCSDAYYSWLPAKITRTPMIIHHRDITLDRSSKFLINQAAANIAISSWQNQHNLGNKGVVIHNAIDVDKFPVQPFLDDKYGNKEGFQIVGLIGRLVPEKGQDIFIRAAAQVVNKHLHTKFLIVGNDQDKRFEQYILSLKSLVKELGLEENVIFTGFVQNSYEIIPYFDISVIPSRREPFGRTIIESMACAKPVISTNVWGPTDIVTPETGFLVPPDDPDALANAILELLGSTELRSKMGLAGRKRVEDFFTIDAMMEKIYNLYEEIVKR